MKRKVPEKTKNKTKVGVWVNMLHKMLFFFHSIRNVPFYLHCSCSVHAITAYVRARFSIYFTGSVLW